MSYLLAVRHYPRLDQPAPVYKGALGLKLWEGPLSVSMDDAQRNCGYRSEERARLDVRAYEWAPSFAWAERVVEALIAKQAPAWTCELKGERGPERPVLVTRAPWAVTDGWIQPVVDGIVRTWTPAWTAELATGLRSPDGPRLDVRGHEWNPEIGWLPKVVDTQVAQRLPVWMAELGVRTEAAPALDVRRFDWSPPFSWVQPVTDATIRTWAGIWAAELGVRTADRAGLDVRQATDGPQPAWLFVNLPPTTTTAQLWPAILQAIGLSYRSGDRQSLVVRPLWAPTDGWIQPVVDATVRTWAPVWSAEVGVRTDAAPLLDVRRVDQPVFSWVQPIVDALVRAWAGVWRAEVGERTADRPVLDVRQATDGCPQPAWIFANLPATTTTAQIWPAILGNLPLSYRSGDRPGLDVRTPWAPTDGWVQPVVEAIVRSWASVWSAEVGLRTDAAAALDVRRVDQPPFSWVERVVEATVSTWSPVFAAQASSLRSPDRPPFDVRLPSWDPGGWVTVTLPPTLTVAQQWPAVLQALAPSYRSAARAVLDVRGQEWAPAFSWVQPIVDLIVGTWTPIFSAQAATGVRTPDGPRVDVRSLPPAGLIATLLRIAGITRDAAGNPLGGVTVKLFLTATDTLEATTVSDVNGNYSITVATTAAHYLYAVKHGAPDVSGGTDDNIQGA